MKADSTGRASNEVTELGAGIPVGLRSKHNQVEVVIGQEQPRFSNGRYALDIELSILKRFFESQRDVVIRFNEQNRRWSRSRAAITLTRERPRAAPAPS